MPRKGNQGGGKTWPASHFSFPGTSGSPGIHRFSSCYAPAGEAFVGSRLIRGIYLSGLNHSPRRPKFYESLGLWQGTINIQVTTPIDSERLIPNRRVPGVDQFDFEENQDFLIRECRLKGTRGFQLLPIDKTTNTPRGHHDEGVIEISLKERIPLVANEDLEVELKFDD